MSEFIQRHIGITDDQKNIMLNDLGLSTIEELVREVVPTSILLRGDDKLPEGCSEQQALAELKEIAEKNIIKRSLIGQGYYGTITPPEMYLKILHGTHLIHHIKQRYLKVD